MSEPWWESFYDDLLADVLLARPDPVEVGRTVDFLVDRLALEPGDSVFDQCSGLGTISLTLSERGFETIGVDQSAAYVEQARREAHLRELSAQFVAADAFEFNAPSCNAAFNWWTSFGYARDDDRNVRMLRRAYESLVPGGRFALDLPNLPSLLRTFRPHDVLRRQTRHGETVLVRESRLDLQTGVLFKTWTYFLPDGRRVVRPTHIRLYMPHTVRELLERSGFADIELVGSVSGEPIGIDSPRCIAVSRRPA